MEAQSAVKPDPMGSSCQSVDGSTMTFFVYQQAAFTSTVAAAVRLRRGVLSRPLVNDFYTTPVTYPAVRARYGRFFERAVRMPEHSFLGLVDALRPRLPSRGLSGEVRTAIALRYLGGGSYLDICAAFGVSPSTMYNCLWEVIDAVNASPTLNLCFDLGDPAWRRRTAQGFQSSRKTPFDNVLGAIDGIAVQQEQPLATDVPCVADYYSRKGFYAFNTQAICNANYEFTWMSCKSPGSCHDSAAFTTTDLGTMLMDNDDPVTAQLIAAGYCIVGDDAYAAGEVMAVPWPGGGGGDQWRDSYNFYQSSCRVHIEQAFGMLVWRWGVFWRPLRVPFLKRPSLIRACFKLHNFCRRYYCSQDDLAPYEVDSAGSSVFFYDNDSAHPSQRGRRRDKERSSLRVRMTEGVRNKGVLRPGVDPMY